MSYLTESRQVFGQPVDSATPIERLILNVALTKSPRDLRLHQLGPEIEGMGRVVPDSELGEKRERVLRKVMSITAIDVDSIIGRLDAEMIEKRAGMEQIQCR